MHKTHCINGHELTTDNQHKHTINGKPYIVCKTCRRKSANAYYARWREKIEASLEIARRGR